MKLDLKEGITKRKAENGIETASVVNPDFGGDGCRSSQVEEKRTEFLEILTYKPKALIPRDVQVYLELRFCPYLFNLRGAAIVITEVWGDHRGGFHPIFSLPLALIDYYTRNV